MIGSFYDPALETGCAFEELISFHGGIGGPQTRPFILHPADLAVPGAPIVGAAAVHEILLGWRRELNGARRHLGSEHEDPTGIHFLAGTETVRTDGGRRTAPVRNASASDSCLSGHLSRLARVLGMQ